MLKKLVALILALVCCVTLFAACGDSGDVTIPNDFLTDNYEAPDLTGAKLTMYMADNADYNPEDTWLNKAVEKELGLDLKMMELSSFTQQYYTMMAEQQIPDLTFGNTINHNYIQFGDDGAYINLYNYLDLMPNVKAYLEDPENANNVQRYTVRDGVMYMLPIKQEGTTNPYTFLYREDIFQKHDLTFPTNQEEFVATLRKLKELYPSSYPLSMRSLTGHSATVTSWGDQWGHEFLAEACYEGPIKDFLQGFFEAKE